MGMEPSTDGWIVDVLAVDAFLLGLGIGTGRSFSGVGGGRLLGGKGDANLCLDGPEVEEGRCVGGEIDPRGGDESVGGETGEV